MDSVAHIQHQPLPAIHSSKEEEINRDVCGTLLEEICLVAYDIFFSPKHPSVERAIERQLYPHLNSSSWAR